MDGGVGGEKDKKEEEKGLGKQELTREVKIEDNRDLKTQSGDRRAEG